MDEVLLTNIQRFSLHDGPGIRTTVFLKGCVVRCPWGANPENLVAREEPYVKDGRPGTYGRRLGAQELVDEIMKDAAFYRGKLGQGEWRISSAEQLDRLPGGVTFSGGEALMQAEALVPVMERLHSEGVHVAVETCLFVAPSLLERVLGLIDLFYVDLKIVDAGRCREVLGGDVDVYSRNLDTVIASGAPVVVRVPVIGGFTDDEENRRAVIEFLRERRDGVLKAELIKGHNLGESKYRSLGLVPPPYTEVSDELMDAYAREVAAAGIPAEVCRI